MTRSPAIVARLLCPAFLLVIVSGCTSTGLGRPKVLPGVRTTALVGDKPVAVVAGLPGESIEIDTRFPGRRDRPREQISGRVVDASGRPVPNARVRLADASGITSSNLATETDSAGGFTIHGLRPGVRYRLAAESLDGPTELIGEREAEAPETNVRIALAASSPVDQADRPDRVHRVSEESLGSPVPEDAPPAPRPQRRTRLARDEIDALPPAREAGPMTADEPVSRPSASSPKQDVWRSADSDVPDAATGSLTFTELPSATADRSAFGLPVEPDAGPDPLPPAIDRDEPFQSAPRPGAIANTEVSTTPGRFELSTDPGVEPAEAPASTPKPISAPANPTFGSPAPSPSNDSFIAAPTVTGGSAPAPIERPTSAPDPDPAPAPKPQPAPAPEPEMPSAPRSREPGFAPEPPSLESPADPPSLPDPSEFGPALESPETSQDSTTLPPLGEPPAVQEPEPSPSAVLPDSPEAPPAPAPAPEVKKTPEPAAPPSEEDALPPIQAPGGDLDLIEQPGRPTGSFESPPEVSRSGVIPEITARAPRASRPTWDELTAQSAQKRATLYPPSTRRTESSKPAGLGLLASLRGNKDKTPAPKSPEVVRASCSFDKGENRLVDFTLPDLQGRPVRFQDIDSDYILIDFWGTWCGPCLRSIPHLVQLQNRYDPKRLRVVGVAYERSEPEENTKSVQGVMRRLGMNYPVLMGESDGEPCPLQSAFHVQAYPTMVLVDRHGRILWRESGSNPMTMTRLDRVIASNTRARAGVLRR